MTSKTTFILLKEVYITIYVQGIRHVFTQIQYHSAIPFFLLEGVVVWLIWEKVKMTQTIRQITP